MDQYHGNAVRRQLQPPPTHFRPFTKTARHHHYLVFSLTLSGKQAPPLLGVSGKKKKNLFCCVF